MPARQRSKPAQATHDAHRLLGALLGLSGLRFLRTICLGISLSLGHGIDTLVDPKIDGFAQDHANNHVNDLVHCNCSFLVAPKRSISDLALLQRNSKKSRACMHFIQLRVFLAVAYDRDFDIRRGEFLKGGQHSIKYPGLRIAKRATAELS